MSRPTCFNKGCSNTAGRLAYDEKFGVYVSFCENHVDEWKDVDHINFEVDNNE